MAGRVRYFLALAFVAAFFLFPAADREEIAFLQTKSWVTDLLGEHFGASEDAADPPPPIPALRVDYAVADGTDQLTGTQRARREARPTEVFVINGAVAEAAKEAGFSASVNAHLARLIAAREQLPEGDR